MTKYAARTAEGISREEMRTQTRLALAKRIKAMQAKVQDETDKLNRRIEREFAAMAAPVTGRRMTVLEQCLFEMNMTPAQFAFLTGINLLELRKVMHLAKAGSIQVDNAVWTQLSLMLDQRYALLRVAGERFEKELTGRRRGGLLENIRRR